MKGEPPKGVILFVDELLKFLVCFGFAAYGSFGLVSPASLVRWNAKANWLTRSWVFETELRARLMSGVILAIGLFGFAGLIWDAGHLAH